jgi:hypothetical protein
MIWQKLGRLFCANHNTDIMVSGGRTPIALHIKDDLYRIYFGAYDEEMRGKIYSLDIDLKQPSKITNLVTDPIIDRGNIGFYDDNGIIPSSIVNHDNQIYLYTIGFSLKNKIIFDAATGLAISHDNGKTFDKFNGPVIDRTIYDPCFAASPCVIYDGGIFKMWYVSCDYWEEIGENKYKHYYNIKYKESKNGIDWDIHSTVAIDYENENEYAISRPAVVKDGVNEYRMWYSYREQENVKTYRIGYAESTDGVSWTRKDSLMKQFDVSAEGWDSEMICYPFVFDNKGKRYMLYNGNGYGKTGFGLAVLKED